MGDVFPQASCDGCSRSMEGYGGSVVPSGPELAVQRVWDDGVCTAIFTNLLARADPVSQARLLAASAPGSGAWLQAFPLCSIGLRLSDQEFRIASGLRIGAPLVRPHSCVRGSEVAQAGHHGLPCRKSA